MKNYLTLVSWLWLLPLWAQQTKPTAIITQQQPEPTAPTILDNEATTFFEAFQTAVTYIANKNVDATKRRAYAASFASQFAEGAKIEVQNGKIKKWYAPLAYFNRLMDLEYEQVKIKIKLKDKTRFQQDAQSWWTTTYTFDQWFLARSDGKTIVNDHTIKTIGLYFLYVPANRTWTKKYGHVLVQSNLPLN